MFHVKRRGGRQNTDMRREEREMPIFAFLKATAKCGTQETTTPMQKRVAEGNGCLLIKKFHVKHNRAV